MTPLAQFALTLNINKQHSLMKLLVRLPISRNRNDPSYPKDFTASSKYVSHPWNVVANCVPLVSVTDAPDTPRMRT